MPEVEDGIWYAFRRTMPEKWDDGGQWEVHFDVCRASILSMLGWHRSFVRILGMYYINISYPPFLSGNDGSNLYVSLYKRGLLLSG